jgi:ATP synthase protein I
VLPAPVASWPAGMSARLKPDVRRGNRQSQPLDAPPVREQDGWLIFSYMLGGMILYGGIGWLAGHWTGITILFPLGMILGIALSIVLIAFRVTRS